MMAQIDTNEGQGDGEYEDQELEEWLTKHNIESAKQKLFEKNVKLQELAEIDPNNAKSYAMNSLGLDEIEANRFKKAIVSLSSHSSAPIFERRISKSQIIILSGSENDAINNLNNKKEEINTNIKNITNRIDILKEINKLNEENINIFKQQIIDKINERLQYLSTKANEEITSNMNILSDHLQSLQKYNNEMNDTEYKINNILLTDTQLNKQKREKRIVELSGNALDKQLIEPEITSQIKININKNIIFNDIHKIGIIDDISDDICVLNVDNETKEDSEYAFTDTILYYAPSVLYNKNSNDNKTLTNDGNDDTDTKSMDINYKQIYLDDFAVELNEMDNMNECWNILGDETESSNNNMTVTKLGNDYSSNFGNIWIDSISHRICLWEIKINNVNKYFAVGISSDDSSENKRFYNNVLSSNYGYCDNGNKVCKDVLEDYGKSWSDGDVIGIKLDEIQKCIEFIHNGESQGIAYNNIDTSSNIKYKLAVHMYYKDSSVTIMKFEYL
eukprot:160420_1